MALGALATACGGGGGDAASGVPAGGDEAATVEVVTTVGADGTAGGPAAPSTVALSVVAQATVPEVVARAAPDDAAEAVAELANPIASGSPLVFLVEDDADPDPDWIQVLLPVEPNGTTGWLRRSDVTLTTNPYRIEIDRETFSLRVFDRDDVWIETTIGVGTGDTPTPVGDFYLLELLAPPDPSGPYGPYAFGLSGFSEVLDSFGSADTAVIGLHGTNDPASIGTNASYGCIRLANDVISELAASLPLGTPVHIT